MFVKIISIIIDSNSELSMIHSRLTRPSKTSAVICIETISYVLTLIQTMNERDFLKQLILLRIVQKETFILNIFKNLTHI